MVRKHGIIFNLIPTLFLDRQTNDLTTLLYCYFYYDSRLG